MMPSRRHILANGEAAVDSAAGETLLSPEQQIMAISCRTSTINAAATGRVICWLQPGADIMALRSAWLATLERHQIVPRPLTNGERRNSASGRAPTLMDVVDCTRTGEEGIREALQQIESANAINGDAMSAPLLAIQTSGAGWCLVWNFSRVLLDTRSCQLVLREVAERSADQSANSWTGTAAEPRYADYALWAHPQGTNAARNHWTGLFPLGVPRPAIVELQPRGGDTGGGADCCEIMLMATFRTELRGLARRYCVSLPFLLFSAWSVVIGRFLRRDTVVCGLLKSGRTSVNPGGPPLIGRTAFVCPYRVNLGRDVPFSRLVDQLRDQYLALRDLGGVPLSIRDMLIEHGHQLHETVTCWAPRSFGDLARRCKGASWTSEMRDENDPYHPLILAVQMSPDLVLQLHYEPPVFDRALIEHLLCLLATTLRAIVRRPDAPLSWVVSSA